MEKFCIFLRGINVNGISIKMQDLKAAFCEMGFTNVQTILATGNVIVTDTEVDRDKEALKLYIEKCLSEHFGYEAHIIVRSQKELFEIYRIAQSHVIPEDCHHYLLLCDCKDLPPELKQLYDEAPHVPNEQLILSEDDAFWVIPKGNTLDAYFGSKVLGSKKYKSRLTSRNMNTIEKIVKEMTKSKG